MVHVDLSGNKAEDYHNRVAWQVAQASADARSANVEVPRLDATLLQLQSELRAMQVALQQAQERALWLESDLSAAQDRIGAAERKAAQAERRYSAVQKRMDDWDAFDPDLHVAVVVGATQVVHYVNTLYIDCWLVCILVVTVAL